MRKRFLALALCLAMVLTLLPVSALAGGDTQPDVGLYDTYDSTTNYGTGTPYSVSNNSYTVSYTAGESKTVYFCVGSSNSLTLAAPTASSPAAAALVGDRVISVTLPDTASGAVSVQISFTIDAGSGPNTRNCTINFADASWASHEVTDADVFTGTYTPAEALYAVTPFQIESTTYYMAVGMRDTNYPNSFNVINPLLGEGQTVPFDVGVSFFISPAPGEFIRLRGEEYADALGLIRIAFDDTLKLEIKALSWENTLPTHFPAIFLAGGDNSCFCGRQLAFKAENEGAFLLTATGTISGAEVKTQTHLTFDPKAGYIIAPDLTLSTDPIVQVNDKIAELVENPKADTTAIIRLPEGDFDGYINIPAEIEGMSFMVQGTTAVSGQMLERKTVLHGGVESYQLTDISDLKFVGAGKDNAAWGTEPAANSDRPNYALYGYGNAYFSDCEFSGYDCAIYSHGQHKLGADSLFIENKTAICLDSGVVSGGNGNIEGNTYVANDVAIHVKSVGEDMPLTWFFIRGSRFINNAVDVKNDVGRNFYLPGNYFAATNSENQEVVRECVYQPAAGASTPKTVHYYPQARDQGCTSFIYDYSSYAAMPVVSNAFSSGFPIPATALGGMSVTVMGSSGSSDVTLGTISFPVAEPLSSRVRLMDVAAFDPTLDVTRTSGGVSVTVNDPLGRTPTLVVPCAGWYGASVTHGGEPVASTLSGGAISFPVAAGGTYTITRLYAPYIPPEPKTTTTTDAVTNEDGAATVTTTTKNSDGSSSVLTETTDADGGVAAEAGVKAAPGAEKVAVPEKIMEALTGADAALTVTTDAAELEFDAEAVAALAESGGKAPEITAAEADRAKLTDEQRALVGDAPVIELAVNGGSLDFGGGSVTVSVPYELKEGESADGLAVWFISADGKLTKCECEYKGGVLSFKTNHFSEYAVAYFPFTDLKDGTWYYENAVYAYMNGLFEGVDGVTFAPEATMTRAMLVTALWRMAGEPTIYFIRESDPVFTDVKGDEWFYEAVLWAALEGIVEGDGGKFSPDDPVTREEIAAMLYRYAQTKGMGFVGSWMFPLDHEDAADISDWAYEAFCYLTMHGVIEGSGGRLSPKAPATRAQVAALLQRFAEKVK